MLRFARNDGDWRAAGAGQVRQQAIAVVRDGIAAPTHVLIRSDQREASAVSGPQSIVSWRQNFQRNPTRLRSGEQRTRAGGIGIR
ncbi:MAG: hypothetical protein JO289_25065, partial [Xanthobacteraceae bacterium]|nr:hypothetical protein [Xanthobacteraceae bacterium]